METMNDSHDLHLHLPYYNAITDEPQEELRGVCDGLSHAVLVGELSPGATFWVQRLNEFILVHKRNMSHEQMVPLVRLLYRLVTIPNLDFNLQERFARTLTKLILKKKSLSSHLIELPWRPLYDILRTIYFGQAETTIYVQRDKHGAAIVKLVEAARRFFPESATREILDEFQSKLCPHDVVLFDAQGWLVLFLPTNHVEGKPTHHELWLDWVFDVWGWVRDDVSTWNGQWLRLIARLVKGQPTAEVHALLEPHLDFLFNKFLSSLNLPVGASAAPKDHRAAMSSGAQVLLLPDGEGQHTIKRMCAIVAWLLSPEGRVIELLRALLRATESFFHPSNSGAWQGRLAQVLYCLCSEVCDRLKKERKPQCPTPPHLRLQDPQRKAFADCMSPVLVPALFSKSHSMVMTSALAHKLLAYICPEAILPQLLESVYPALQTLTESHQTLAALGCLCFVARPLLSKSVYPSGGEHLVNLLMLSLPGIDPNDPIKTETTFKFYRSVLQCVRIEDISGPSFTLRAGNIHHYDPVC
ncbi:hypothetical protein SARC_05123 [Sphaeroforma arctica JP610]|uniref:Proteasome activator Blm10 middle HEAT repeats region domain-containing protein n=1 Tax=Sphaeroforma arctica JP610 TaxID=667725 RepID=A0A0L0G352_9EUKA|nr:hypothetical protein SARC_05123 [Sphaeroforma arctica JP610]KNC82588.1 hypothetical protein SARC_05123 [Sphaeroforma arctica JP610]|eukprot:XP_014156490.1 hypothetical protein SARC_05123 [Sphaeroforma arctica JP610]